MAGLQVSGSMTTPLYTLRTPDIGNPNHGLKACLTVWGLVEIALGKTLEGGGGGGFLGWYTCCRAMGVGFRHGFQRRLSEFKSWSVRCDLGEFR